MGRIGACALTAVLLGSISVSTCRGQDWITANDIYGPYVEVTGQAGGHADTVQGLAFIPLYGDQENLLFADLRGTWSDQQTAEGNWGVGFRHLTSSQWIYGGYAFYDLRHSRFNNNFSQATIGLELMNVDWDFRVNGYIPETTTKAAAGATQVSVSGGGLVVNAGQEKAYYGSDFEVGYLFGDWNNGDMELRGYAGGYYFDRSGTGFNEIAGPRVRTELRLYDLSFLGNGSRLVAGAQYQYDDVRGSQGSALLQVRIPIGGSRRKLCRIHRRMLNPIVRDIDVVSKAAASGADEGAIIALNDQLITGVTVVDANTMNVRQTVLNAPNAPGEIVVFDGSQGDIIVDNTIRLQEGQFAGGVFEVYGENSGTRALYGNRANIVGMSSDAPTDTDSDVARGFEANNIFRIQSGSILTGLSIQNGGSGILGRGVNDFMIVDNIISGSQYHGIELNGSNSGRISDNNVSGAEYNGIYVNGLSEGMIVGNTATNNGEDGFYFGRIGGGEFSGNTATDNGDDGIEIDRFASGEAFENVATNNGDNGFTVGRLAEVHFHDNRADENEENGFDFDRVVGGFIEENTAKLNGDDGFDFERIKYGYVIDNTSNQNGDDGFDIETAGDEPRMVFGFERRSIDMMASEEDGYGEVVIVGNVADRNEDDGFAVYEMINTIFAENVASNNVEDGFDVEYISGGGRFFDDDAARTVEDEPFFGFGVFAFNEAINNGEDGFYIGDYYGGGFKDIIVPVDGPFVSDDEIEEFPPFGGFIGNIASGNGGDGFDFYSFSGLMGGNEAIDNGGDGFYIEDAFDAYLVENTATGNGYDGFYLEYAEYVSLYGNVAADNQGDGFYIYEICGFDAEGNLAENNLGSGFAIEDSEDGYFAYNEAIGNDGDGFYFGDVEYVDFYDNIASGNGANGFLFDDDADDIDFYGNLAAENGATGFNFYYVEDADVESNVADANGGDGFYFYDIEESDLTKNDATDNLMNGYLIENDDDLDASGNTGSGNGNNDTFNNVP